VSQRNSGGIWTSIGATAKWLGVPARLLRVFVFHLRVEGKLPDAWDYNVTETPRTVLDRQWIYDNWTEWAETWQPWRDRVGQ
jgi:hypothetical protein